MFIDEETEAYLKNSSKLDSRKKIGVWRTVVIHNPPYTDGRRTGKVRFIVLFLQLLLTLVQTSEFRLCLENYIVA